jgi:hypothetical protein
LKQAGDVAGKVIVTCSLPMNAKNTDLVVARDDFRTWAVENADGRPGV